MAQYGIILFGMLNIWPGHARKGACWTAGLTELRIEMDGANSPQTNSRLRAGLDDALTQSAHDLAQAFERHRALLMEALNTSEMDGGVSCPHAGCACRRTLRKTLTETIAVLDDTRKSFKSTQLAMLRRRLMQILGEHG